MELQSRTELSDQAPPATQLCARFPHGWETVGTESRSCCTQKMQQKKERQTEVGESKGPRKTGHIMKQ